MNIDGIKLIFKNTLIIRSINKPNKKIIVLACLLYTSDAADEL